MRNENYYGGELLKLENHIDSFTDNSIMFSFFDPSKFLELLTLTISEDLDMNILDEITIKKEHLQDLTDFFKRLSKSKKAFMHHTLRYKQLADMLESNKIRSLACHYAMGGIILGSDSRLYYCKNSKAIGNCLDKSATAIYFDEENLRYRKNLLIKKRCLSCPPNTFNKIEAEKDLLKLIKFFLLNKYGIFLQLYWNFNI